MLFWIPAAIWGSTWHVITWQLGEVPPINSVAYRFGLAALVLFAVTAARREPLVLSQRTIGLLALAGLTQYGLSYWAVYQAEELLPSGLVAILFTTIVFFNAAIGAVWFAEAVRARFVIGATVAVAGIVMIFWPEVAAGDARPGVKAGLVYAVVGVIASAIGGGLTLAAKRRGATLFAALAWSMAWGSIGLALATAASGRGFAFSFAPRYLASLAYLALIGSVVSFAFYTALAARRGPGHAGLVGIASPVAALALSAAFEDWRPDALACVGIVVCLAGLLAAMRPAGTTAVSRN